MATRTASAATGSPACRNTNCFCVLLTTGRALSTIDDNPNGTASLLSYNTRLIHHVSPKAQEGADPVPHPRWNLLGVP